MDLPPLESLLSDEALRRQEFPVVEHKVFLGHAGVCPLPACVVRAISSYAEKAARAGQFEYLHRQAERECRELTARMLEASPDEIAFVPSTSAGVSLVAEGLDWWPGDRVVIAEGDFPANVYPWLNLQRRGVEVRMIPRRPSALITWADVEQQLDERTRLVSLSSIHYATGAGLDVAGIGEQLQAKKVLFCVDAIQSLGAVPSTVRNVDFLIADAHKWLLGPQGIGVLYVRRDRLAQLNPVLTGWKSVPKNKDFSRIQHEFAGSAQRYEPGSLNVLGIVGLHAALVLLHAVGIPTIAARLQHLRTLLLAGLRDCGHAILGVAAEDCPTGITSFRPRTEDCSVVYRRLGDRGIVVSLRDDPMGQPCLRVSPHFYNTETEIAALLAQL